MSSEFIFTITIVDVLENTFTKLINLIIGKFMYWETDYVLI